MKFFNIVNHSADQKSATVQIMEQIGYNWWTDKGTEATDFINEVRALGDLESVKLEINSPGGNVYDGVSIANFIKSHPAKWEAVVIGQAASIATVIACACDSRQMGVGTNWLVHKPMSIPDGYINADECRALAVDLDTIENSILDFYMPLVEAKGKSKDELVALLAENRYMSVEEAMEWGFIDSSATDIKAVAYKDAQEAAQIASLRAALEFKEAQLKAIEPAKEINFKELLTPETDEAKALNEKLEQAINESGFELVRKPEVNIKDVIDECSKAGLSDLIPKFVDSGKSIENIRAEIKTAQEIKDYCATVEVDHEQAIKHMGDTLSLLRFVTAEALAAADLELSQDGVLPSGVGEGQKPVIDTDDVYKQRNQKGK